MIPFNKPHLFGNELLYIQHAVNAGKISGDGMFTEKCHHFFEKKYGIKKTLLTSSCTDALEMIAILCNIEPGDEIIAPSYTFVSTVNPFVMRGAHVKFCDVKNDHPCMDENQLPELITPRTKAIVAMHYGGVACNMDMIKQLAEKNNLQLVEDAAHAMDAYYRNQPLGTIGSMAAFSFHETKNVMAGEGGMIAINNNALTERAEVIREKGTNRSNFFRGEVDKYTWTDIGSSFLPSELTAAFLYAQLERLDDIQQKRMQLWNLYYEKLKPLALRGTIGLPVIPEYARHNAHLFYLITANEPERDRLIKHLAAKDIMAIFHYQPLHSSPFWKTRYKGNRLTNTEHFSHTLVRLPLYFDLRDDEVMLICDHIIEFYER